MRRRSSPPAQHARRDPGVEFFIRTFTWQKAIINPGRNTDSHSDYGPLAVEDAISSATSCAQPFHLSDRQHAGGVGAWGVNLYDNDLVPIDATPIEHERIVFGIQESMRAQRHRGSNGYHQPVLSLRVPGWRIHRERSGGSHLGSTKDHARDGFRRRIGRQNIRPFGADAREQKRTRADGLKSPSNACVKQSIICASTTSIEATASTSPWKRSPTNRGETSTCPPRGITWL